MQDIGTGQPLLRDSDYNQFFRYQAQSQHGGERDKGGEAQQLSEYGKLPCLVIGNPGKDGLCNAVYHARNRGMSHAVPLVCLRKVTHFPFRVELTQQDGKQIVIDYGKDIRNDYLAAESYHLPDRCKVEPEARSPTREVEVKNRHYGDERDALQCNSPIGESVCRQCDAHNAGDYQT